MRLCFAAIRQWSNTNTKVSPIVITQDAVVTGLPAELVQNLGKNIHKQLVQGLEDRGINVAMVGGDKGKEAVVTVDVTGVQSQNVFDAGPFGASTKTVFGITYSALLFPRKERGCFGFKVTKRAVSGMN